MKKKESQKLKKTLFFIITESHYHNAKKLNLVSKLYNDSFLFDMKIVSFNPNMILLVFFNFLSGNIVSALDVANRMQERFIFIFTWVKNAEALLLWLEQCIWFL